VIPGAAVVLLVIMALVLPAAPATADSLTLHYSGIFGPTSSLGGVPFGAPTPFTFQATFDSTTDTEPSDGFGAFDAAVTFSISGFGTFTSDDVDVLLIDTAGGPSAAGLGDVPAHTSGFLGSFSTATPVFDADAPVPSVLSGFGGIINVFPFTVPLTGGAGDLVFNDFSPRLPKRRRSRRRRCPCRDRPETPRPALIRSGRTLRGGRMLHEEAAAVYPGSAGAHF
jgi:hypothetical protein